MPALTVVGAQWGDEGKGKLVDCLTERAHLAVRFQGGNNAGHTLVVGGKKTKLSLVPSGILHRTVRGVIGAGCVLNPEVLLAEIQTLHAAGVEVTPDRLLVDYRAQLILDYHIALDQAREASKGDQKIGTTGRGIGPAYEDRAERVGVRVCDLMDLAVLKPRMVELVRIRNLELEYVLKAQQRIVFDELWAKIEHVAQVLIPFLGDGGEEVYQALIAGKRVVFEGAQGTLLDQSFGAVPFVTSCHTIAGAAATGCGIGPKMLDYTLGVTKAYATRVGSGPFPTELSNATGDLIRERGGEFGTVTGRPRRCGWLDLVALRYACRLNGVDSLAITKLDVLSGIPKIQLCIRYKIDGKEVKDPPPLTTDHAKITPYFIELDGWEGDLSQARRWYQLPEAARLYLSSVSDILGRPISMISVGADREHTIVLNNATFIKNFMQVQE